ncbi:MAG: peptide deformylase [Oscillospiraceae bacterium]|nr:peptide deformylase [Oscillospiraceae bacterium]
MVRELMHDPIFLAQPAAQATAEDLPIAQDLLDTLAAHRETCVGMAANMIGKAKAIIAFDDGRGYTVMLNPKLLKASGEYEAEESCLSLLGGPRKTKRYEKIKVQYQNLQLQTRIKTYEGFPAQIIQHELDHLKGILI